jgi:predicted O-methyltransferase YrrM
MDKRTQFSAFLRQIQSSDPFEGFPVEPIAEDSQGFQVSDNSPFFDQLFSLLAPRTLLELGTWKGSSAIGFANRMLTYCDAPVIACVDTWVGSLEHWATPSLRAELHLRWGYPTLYCRFVANVIRAGVAPWIIPLPMLTETALQLMTQRDVFVDVVYLDASHEYDAVKRDISDCWDVVDETGFVLADDYLSPGVQRAIKEFCSNDTVFGLVNADSSWPQALLLKHPETFARVTASIADLSPI